MRIGFIGTGNMGGAIMKGYIASPMSDGNEILIHNRSNERNEAASSIGVIGDSVKITVCENNRELAELADIIVIGVKPDGVEGVLKEIIPEVCRASAGKKIIVSMAAGISISRMEQVFAEDCDGRDAMPKIIRIMPNTPALVGEAVTSMSRNANVTDSEFAEVAGVLDAVGMTREVSEDLIDCVIGVSGSSTAYTYMYIEALAEAAVENGMDSESARIFAAKAVKGAAEMALRSDKSLKRLRDDVCSPNGTTIKAVETLLDNGFMDKAKEGFQAAVERSKEMGK